MGPHLLNLLELAGAPLDDFEVRAFGGREAISEPFDFQLDLYSKFEGDVSGWIGKHSALFGLRAPATPPMLYM